MAVERLNGAGWFGQHAAGAPSVLRERAARFLDAEPDHAPSPERLAGAARRALAAVLAGTGDRSVALDLLAADALVTLALLAKAQQEPAGLARFAASLRT